MATSDIDVLRTHADRLSRLLADPHPGLSTWCDAYHAALISIANYMPADELTTHAARLAMQQHATAPGDRAPSIDPAR